jgi:hypothetical protein
LLPIQYLENSTLNAEDKFHSLVVENYAIMVNLHDQCFLKCAVKMDMTYMTNSEGNCFRNCINKFNNWYPLLAKASEDAAYKTYWGLTIELEKELKKKK